MTRAPHGQVPPENVFAVALASIDAALAASEAADAALDARMAELDRRTSEELSFYELLGGQAHNENTST